MFDKLVESDTTGAEFNNRSRYFMVSSVFVGILFLTAVVYSLYAAEVGLGSGNFEIAELIAPVSPDAPEPDRPQPPAASDRTSSTVRNVDSDIARVDEPTIVPTKTSAEQNTAPSRGYENFDPRLPTSPGGGAPGGMGIAERPGTGSHTGVKSEPDETEPVTSVPPPAANKPKPPDVLRTSRVLNGQAISLPKPAYPQTAVLLNLQGTVKVQITIDESGKVISSKAAEGHHFFRQVAEQAARSARFKPTLLNGEPVKVTGMIVYNFKRN